MRAPVTLLAAALPAMSLLAACAAPQQPPPEASAAAPAKAVLVAIRPVPNLQPTGILAPLAGLAGNSGVELVARMPDGRALSVVQPDAGGLHPGEAILLIDGPPPRMVAGD